jgi:uncharacterized peroxidase-related enzyme
MAWIRLPSVREATGLLRAEYDAAIARAGRIWQIVRITCLNPLALKQSIGLYATLMKGPSPLSRAQREMLAVVVSKANDCHYWTEAHAHDLRAEVDDDELVEQIKTDWTAATLQEADRALLQFAIDLTKTPGAMTPAHVDGLRAAGFDDRSISDAVHIISYFNYINRVADGLGVDLEEWMPPHPHGDREVRGE